MKSLHPNLRNLPHPAAPLLHRLASLGVPAPSQGPPWTIQKQDAAVRRGPHPSAGRQHAAFILEDMYNYVRAGYWLVLPYQALRGHPNLKIAPAGVVPQRERRPRPIMDYTYNGVNSQSIPLAPPYAMQFGGALQRILQHLAYANPAYGPPLMAKLDLSDGYYRIPLSAHAALELAVILPPDGNSGPLLGIPLSLPMGWSLSPPYFCLFTETVADLANTILAPHPEYPPLSMDHIPRQACPLDFHPTALWTYNMCPPQRPMSLVDVYLDDFMAVAQQPFHEPTLNNLLHHLHTVFYDAPGAPRKRVISMSKVDTGDALFSSNKRILGWDIDTHHMHIRLPVHRQQRLCDLIHKTLDRPFSTRRRWQCLLGELRSVTLAVHSSKYLFSILQHALARVSSRRFRITSLLKAALRDWVTLLQQLTAVPVPIAMTVPHAPHFWGATDASREGLGGFWLPSTLAPNTPPCAWRYRLPHDLMDNLVTASNPSGTINNSDLELAALVLGHDTQLSHNPTLPYTCTMLGTDNIAAKTWLSKGSTTTTGPPAFLLRHLAGTCRKKNAVLQPLFIAGQTNTIADFLSRSFHLTDDEFLTRLQLLAPLQPPWRLVTPPATSTYEMNLALSRQLRDLPSQLAALTPTTPHGQSGLASAWISPATPSSATYTTPFLSCKYSLHGIAWEHWLPPPLQSALARWKAPFVPWGRRSPHWVTRTPACNLLVA